MDPRFSSSEDLKFEKDFKVLKLKFKIILKLKND